MSTDGTPIPVAPENPWPGLASYTEEQHELFFGRESETEELLRLIQRDTLTVLFGRSGSGKSSLLHAGVFPRLRSGMYFPVLLRLNFADPNVDPVEQVKAFTLAAAQKGGFDIDSHVKQGLTPTLWEFFHNTDFWGPRNDRLTPLLIFDQFEEAFTIGKDQRQSSDFLGQLADLAENRVPLVVEQRVTQSNERVTIDAGAPNYKIVLSLREDFVSRLDQLRPILPAIMRNRMGLLPLDGARAIQVIVNSGTPWVSETVAEDIVAALAGESGAAQGAVAQAEIEPAYLSVMCHELFRRMVELGHESITSELVARERGEILEAMYERSFEGLAEPVRLFVEDHLLTPSGFRGTLPLTEALAEGVTLYDLETLVDRRLLRFEDRLGTRHVELSHDLLTGVVKKSRGFRADRVAREEEERKQQELRHALGRARRRTVIAAATAILALAGVAYSVYYWLAYIHPTSAYYKAFSDQMGVIAPYGEINIATMRHRKISYKVTREGFRGEILSLEAVDRDGNPTLQNDLSTALNSDRSAADQDTSSRYCCMEFQYDKEKNGRMVYETAWDQKHHMVWGFMYVPAQSQDGSQQTSKATYFGPDGLPKPQRTGSEAEIIEIAHAPQGHVTLKYLSWDAQPVPGPDNAYGKEIVYDPQGRETSETSLDANGHPINDASGNATAANDYDNDDNPIAAKSYDATGRPTLLISAGYSIVRFKYDQWGNQTEMAYFDVDGSPVVSQTDGGHIIRLKYDDRGNNTEQDYFDIYGNPMDKLGDPSYHQNILQYNAQNQLTRETFFDSFGKPAKGDRGVYDIRFEYDANSNISAISMFDENGKPANDSSNIHIMRLAHNESGQTLEVSYFGIDSKPVDIQANGKDQYQSYKIQYDQNGRRYKWNYYDVNGNPPAGLGFSEEQESFDRWGNMIGDQILRTPQSTFTYDIVQTTYDDFADPLKACYLNADQTPAARADGVSCIEKVYDDRGLVTEATNHGKDGGLKADKDGITRAEYAYNDKRQETREEFFGLKGPVNGPDGAAHVGEIEYDTAGHKTQINRIDVSGSEEIDHYDLQGRLIEGSFYDAQGKRMDAKGNTYADVRYEFAAQGTEVTTRYFGTNEQPVVAKDGCATLREDRNAEGQALKDACFDANGHPMTSLSTYGAATVTFAYDAGGQLTDVAGYDPAGNPVENIYGYARFKVTEDSAENPAQKDFFDRYGVLILRWTPAKSCNLSQPGTSNPTADCIISDASQAYLRAGPKKSYYVVSSIHDNSTAMKIQLHLGDVLLENDGITEMEALREHFNAGPNRPRKLVILRNGKPLSFEIPKGLIGVTIGVATSSQ
jgi:YD repeat-containing protein